MNIIEWALIFSPLIIMLLGALLWIKQSRIKLLETWNVKSSDKFDSAAFLRE